MLFQLLKSSGSSIISFLFNSWIEWFIPNVAVAVAWFYARRVLAGAIADVSPVASYGVLALDAALFHAFMVFRGFLFKELSSSTPRQRTYRYGGKLIR